MFRLFLVTLHSISILDVLMGGTYNQLVFAYYQSVILFFIHMVIQVNNTIQRDNTKEKHGSDIAYLLSFFEENKHFPFFSQVLIETRTDCNNRCSFCPQSHYRKSLGEMSWDCFVTVISQLEDMKFAGRIAFFLSNEPLLDKRLLQMIRYAREHVARAFLDITTNGKLLTVSVVDDLLSSGIDNITINDYRSDRDVSSDSMSQNLKEVMDVFRFNPKVCYKPRRTDEQLPNYAGIIEQQLGDTEYGFCNYPFRKLTIAYNGDVLLCCNDFSYKTKFGNVLTDSLVSAWNSSEYNDIRLSLLQDKRINLCSKCNETQEYNIF